MGSVTGSRQNNAHYLNYNYYLPSLNQHYVCCLISGNAFHFLLASGVNQGLDLVCAHSGHSCFQGWQMALIVKMSWRFVRYPLFIYYKDLFQCTHWRGRDYFSTWSYWKIHTRTRTRTRNVGRNPLSQESPVAETSTWQQRKQFKFLHNKSSLQYILFTVCVYTQGKREKTFYRLLYVFCGNYTGCRTNITM